MCQRRGWMWKGYRPNIDHLLNSFHSVFQQPVATVIRQQNEDKERRNSWTEEGTDTNSYINYKPVNIRRKLTEKYKCYNAFYSENANWWYIGCITRGSHIFANRHMHLQISALADVKHKPAYWETHLSCNHWLHIKLGNMRAQQKPSQNILIS